MSTGIINFEEKQLKSVLDKLAKRTFEWRNYVKSEKEWWTLYTVAAMCGKIRDERLKELTGRRRSDAGELVFNCYFRDQGYYSFYDMPRGKRQSFTYKMKRIEENLNNFARYEVHGGNRWSGSKTLKEGMEIKTLYFVQANRCNVGAVLGLNEEHAMQLANMFVRPMLPKDFSGEDVNFGIHRRFEVWSAREMQDYIETCNYITEQIKKSNSERERRIDQISHEIENSKLIINSLRSNLMVQLDVES